MNKKIVIYFLIITLLNFLIGCYYQVQMNADDFEFNEEEDIQVTTKDTTYNFIGKDYYYENDTLFATVSKKIDNQTKLKTNVRIPVENIEGVEVEKTDTAATILLGLGIVVGVFVLAFLFSTDFGDDIY